MMQFKLETARRKLLWLSIVFISGCAGTITINPSAIIQRKTAPPDAAHDISHVTINKSNFSYAINNWPAPIFNPEDFHSSSSMERTFVSALDVFMANPTYSNFLAVNKSSEPFIRFMFLYTAVTKENSFEMPVAKNGKNIDKAYWPTPTILEPVVNSIILVSQNNTNTKKAYAAASILRKLYLREYYGEKTNLTIAEFSLLKSSSGSKLATIMKNYINNGIISEAGHIFTYTSDSGKTHSIKNSMKIGLNEWAKTITEDATQISNLPLNVTNKLLTGKSSIHKNQNNNIGYYKFSAGYQYSKKVLLEYLSAANKVETTGTIKCNKIARSSFFDQAVYAGAEASSIAYNKKTESFSVNTNNPMRSQKYTVDTAAEYKDVDILHKAGYYNGCAVYNNKINCNKLKLSAVFFKGSGDNDLEIAAFRGTVYVKNWLDDFKQIAPALGLGLGLGTQRPKIYTVANGMIHVLKSFENHKKIIVVGHSLGGGLAEYSSIHNNTKYYTYNPARLYPIGEEKIGLGYNFTTQDVANHHIHDFVSGNIFGVLYGCLYSVPMKFHGHFLKHIIWGGIGGAIYNRDRVKGAMRGAFGGALEGGIEDIFELHSISNMVAAIKILSNNNYIYKQVRTTVSLPNQKPPLSYLGRLLNSMKKLDDYGHTNQ